MQAEFIRFEGDDSVVIRRDDGWSDAVPIERFSETDRDWLDLEKKRLTAANIDWRRPQNSETYLIRRIKRETVPGYIRTAEGWEHGIQAIAAQIQYTRPGTSDEIELRAYFYDSNGALIETQRKPARMQDDNGEYHNPPKKLSQGEEATVYFPLSKFLDERGWRRVIVAYGNGKTASVDMMPSDQYQDYAFEEKSLVFPDWDPVLAEKNNQNQNLEYTLEIKDFSLNSHQLSMFMDGEWRTAQQCLNARIRVKGELPTAPAKLKLYLYDRNGTLIYQHDKPTMTSIGNGEYIQVPRIADTGDWYPVYFGIDKDIRKLDWHSAVIVFSMGNASKAASYSNVGATLDTLDFPEKAKTNKPVAAPSFMGR